MSKLWIICLGLFVVVITSIAQSSSEDIPPSTSMAYDFVNLVIRDARAKIQRKYSLYPYGTVISMPGGPVRELGLAFQVRGALSKEVVRAMLLDCAQMLLQTVLDCEGMRPFLHDPNFDIKNVRIILYIADVTGHDVYDPEIGVGDISDGILTYRTNDRENEFRYKNKFKESYEEALKATRNGTQDSE